MGQSEMFQQCLPKMHSFMLGSVVWKVTIGTMRESPFESDVIGFERSAMAILEVLWWVLKALMVAPMLLLPMLLMLPMLLLPIMLFVLARHHLHRRIRRDCTRN